MRGRKKLIEFFETVRQAINAQIVPQLFSAEEKAEMELPHHRTNDHYFHILCGHNEDLYGVKATLAIADPRIADEIIEKAPHRVLFAFHKNSFYIPVAVEKYSSARQPVAAWQADRQAGYVMRAAVGRIEADLKSRFNWANGKNYDIESVDAGATAFFQLYLKRHASQKRQDAVRDCVEVTARAALPARSVDVRIIDYYSRASHRAGM